MEVRSYPIGGIKMRKTVSIMNTGALPVDCIWASFNFLLWMGKWHLAWIDCFTGDETYLGEFPRWAISPELQKEVDRASLLCGDSPTPKGSAERSEDL